MPPRTDDGPRTRGGNYRGQPQQNPSSCHVTPSSNLSFRSARVSLTGPAPGRSPRLAKGDVSPAEADCGSLTSKSHLPQREITVISTASRQAHRTRTSHAADAKDLQGRDVRARAATSPFSSCLPSSRFACACTPACARIGRRGISGLPVPRRGMAPLRRKNRHRPRRAANLQRAVPQAVAPSGTSSASPGLHRRVFDPNRSKRLPSSLNRALRICCNSRRRAPFWDPARLDLFDLRMAL